MIFAPRREPLAQAGLVVGCLAEELPTRVVRISADEKKDDAKAAAGLIDLIRRGRFKRDETVCFWHTGGNIALG